MAGRRVNVADEQIIKSTTSSSEPLVKGNVVRKISSKYSGEFGVILKSTYLIL